MHNTKMRRNKQLQGLLDIVAELRDNETGCEWHLAQDFNSIMPYTIEEAYEVAEAIEQRDMPALRDELGDLLFQVVYHSRLAEEQQAFNFTDVVEAACEKMVRRHPHVFESAVAAKTPTWEQFKRVEKKSAGQQGVLSGVGSKQPAMRQAEKLQKQASAVGFDWDNLQDVVDKLDEEIAELKHEIQQLNQPRIEEEFGDVLFSCINLARHLKVNPEHSLRQTNRRFSARFEYIEQALKDSALSFEECSLAELDHLWEQAKKAES